jgi:pimeloyl-ACP methyl ester carboxylesterase
MSDPTRKEFVRDGGAMSYLEWTGPSRTALHFAHANGFNAETYRTLLSPLADRLHIFASDARGHGFTTLPTSEGPKNWLVYRNDLDALLAHVHPGPIVLAGHSMGAIASLMFAVAHPERVRALVLVEPVLVPAMHPLRRQFARAMKRFTNGEPDLADRAAKRRDRFASFDAVFAAYRGRGAFQTWPEEMLRDYLRGGLVATGNGDEVRLGCTPAWESESFRSTPSGASRLTARLHCPLTVLHADDGTARASEIAIIRRSKPDARILRVGGATHFLPMEFPDIVREEILRAAHA